MYKQSIIDSVGENYLNTILYCKSTTFINDNSLDSVRRSLALQHYLVKCKKENIYVANVDYFINFYLDDFCNKPYKYVNSPLIRNAPLALFSDKTKVEYVKKVRNSYYGKNAFEILYNEKKRRTLSSEESDRYYAILIHNMDNANPKVNKIIEEEARSILNNNSNITSLSDMALQFYGQYISNCFCNMVSKDKESFPVSIICDRESLGGEQNGNAIYMNKNSSSFSIQEYTKCVCHESQHVVQFSSSTVYTNNTSYEYAINLLFRKYLTNSSYDYYKKNYRYSTPELESESKGFFYARVILGNLGRNDLSDELLTLKDSRLKRRNYYRHIVKEDGGRQYYDQFVVSNLDKIISEHPEELKNYPSLETFYKSDGTKRRFSNIVMSRMNCAIDNRNIFDSHIDYGIVHDQLEEIPIATAKLDNIKRFMEVFSLHFLGKVSTVNDYLWDDTYHNMPDVVVRTTLHELYICYKCMCYVESHFDELIKIKGDEKFNNNHNPLFSFIYGFRDFDIARVKNTYLLNDPRFHEKMEIIVSKCRDLVLKFNYYYLVDRLTIFTDDELDMIYDGNRTVRDVLLTDVLNNMDSHQYVNFEGNKIYITDYLTSVKSWIDKNKKSVPKF